MDKMTGVRDHFEDEAHSYDGIINKLIPHYGEMVDALVSAIPNGCEEPICVLDLGCGTGTVSAAIKKRFPHAQFTLVDISAKMLDIALGKVGSDSLKESHNEDFYQYEISETYHVIVSSLALHHLISNEDKKEFYTKIHNSLKRDGVFYNADVILGSSDFLQNMYMGKWMEYMNRQCSMEEITETWLPKYKDEDSPAKLSDQLNWLRELGFAETDVIWKYYNFAVYGGKKK